jgi:hypothetical protein
MKLACAKALLTIILCLAAKPISAQQEAPTLETMLSDAGYVFNRYEELVTGIDCDSWNVSDSMKRTCRGELKSIGENVRSVKPILARLSSTKGDNLVALFDVYRELNEVASHLGELSTNVPDFTQNGDGKPYVLASSKTLILAAHLGNEIELRLVNQQSVLARCEPKAK